MGTDITPYLELKINGSWMYVGQINSQRQYHIFGKLSGVRVYDSKNKYGIATQILCVDDFPTNISKEIYDLFELESESTHNGGLIYLKDLKKLLENEFDINLTPEMVLNNDKLTYEKCPFFLKEWVEMIEFYVKNGVAENGRIIMWYNS